MKKFIKSLAVVLSFVMILTVVTPVSNVQAAKIKLNYTKKTIYEGDTFKLKVKGTKKKVKWSSSNKGIASVNSRGVVTGECDGKVTIIAKVAGKKLKCKVVVKEYVVDDDTDNSDDSSNNDNTNSTENEVSYDTFNKYEKMAVDGLVQLYGMLKDPSSLRINKISHGVSSDFIQPLECVVIDYNATNSFGGSVRGYCMIWYSLSDEECFNADCSKSISKYFSTENLDKDKIWSVTQKYL